MIKQLVKLANHLDSKGLTKEADELDGVVESILQMIEDKSIDINKIDGGEQFEFDLWIDEDGKAVEAEPVDHIDTFPEEYSNLDETNISKDEAFSAGCSVCGSQSKDDCDHKLKSYMIKPQLYKIYEYAKKLHDMLDDDEPLQDWAESNISKMDYMIESVYHSYDYKEKHHHAIRIFIIFCSIDW